MNKVLIISHSWPYFPGPGAETRAFCLFQQLSQQFDLSFLLPYTLDETKQNALSKLGIVHTIKSEKKWQHGEWQLHQIKTKVKQIQPYNPLFQLPQLVESVKELAVLITDHLKQRGIEHYDLVHLFHPHLAFIFELLKTPLPKTLDWVDERTSVLEGSQSVNNLNLRQQIKINLEIKRLKRYQQAISKLFDASYVSSTIDAKRLYQFTQVCPLVVPNGVDTDYFHLLPNSSKSTTLVFSGYMGYEPNANAVVYFCKEVLPLIKQRVPDIRLVIVGMDPTPEVIALAEKYPNHVTVTGKVDDVRPYFTEAVLSVVPLRIGGGTRLKILESLAMGRPVITTTIGCKGLAVEDEKHLLIRDNAQSFAEAVVRLLKDGTVRQNLVKQGRQLVEVKYSWSHIAQTVAHNWRHLIEKN